MFYGCMTGVERVGRRIGGRTFDTSGFLAERDVNSCILHDAPG